MDEVMDALNRAEAQEECYQYFQFIAWREVELRRAEDELFAKEFDLLQEMRNGS